METLLLHFARNHSKRPLCCCDWARKGIGDFCFDLASKAQRLKYGCQHRSITRSCFTSLMGWSQIIRVHSHVISVFVDWTPFGLPGSVDRYESIFGGFLSVSVSGKSKTVQVMAWPQLADQTFDHMQYRLRVEVQCLAMLIRTVTWAKLGFLQHIHLRDPNLEAISCSLANRLPIVGLVAFSLFVKLTHQSAAGSACHLTGSP